MSELREAAQAVVDQWDTPNWKLTVHTGVLIDRLRAALAQPKTELRDQHKAFAKWFVQQNPIAPNVEDMAWAAWKAALAQPEAHPPRDEWREASEPPEDLRQRVIAWRTPPHRQSGAWVEALYDDGAWVTRDGVARDITHWRDVTPPTTEGK